MGIFSTLLTGASMVGKIAQGLSSAFATGNKIISSEKGTVYDSDMTVGGAKFYISNLESPDLAFENHIANPTTMPLSLCLPNINDVGGMEYIIPPKSSTSIDNMLSNNIPPLTELLIGPISDQDVVDSLAAASDTSVKINLNRLNLDNKPISIGGLTLSADFATETIKVKSIDSAIGAITYFSGLSQNNISNEIRDVIIPKQTSEALTAGVERTYNIPFKELGFKNGDELNCRIYFSTLYGMKDKIDRAKKLCTPLHPEILFHYEKKSLDNL